MPTSDDHSQTPVTATSKAWVLIADDDRVTRMLIGRLVQQANPTAVVVQAPDGIEALLRLEQYQKLFNNAPRLIVTDLNMPNMDGWKFTETVRQTYDKHIPIIVLTSTSGEKGVLFKKSIHCKKIDMSPLVTISKEKAMATHKFDAAGTDALHKWIQYFLSQ